MAANILHTFPIVGPGAGFTAPFTVHTGTNFTAGSDVILPLEIWNGADPTPLALASVSVNGTSAELDGTQQDVSSPNGFAQIWRAHNVAGGGDSIVFTPGEAVGGTYMSGAALETSGLDAGTQPIATVFTEFDNNSIDPHIYTTTTPSAAIGDLVVVALNSGAPPSSLDPNYTQTNDPKTDGSNMDGGGGFRRIAVAGGNQTFVWNDTTQMNCDVVMAVYKAATGGGGGEAAAAVVGWLQ